MLVWRKGVMVVRQRDVILKSKNTHRLIRENSFGTHEKRSGVRLRHTRSPKGGADDDLTRWRYRQFGWCVGSRLVALVEQVDVGPTVRRLRESNVASATTGGFIAIPPSVEGLEYLFSVRPV